MDVEKVEFGGIAIINCISKTSNSWVLKMQLEFLKWFYSKLMQKLFFETVLLPFWSEPFKCLHTQDGVQNYDTEYHCTVVASAHLHDCHNESRVVQHVLFFLTCFWIFLVSQ